MNLPSKFEDLKIWGQCNNYYRWTIVPLNLACEMMCG